MQSVCATQSKHSLFNQISFCDFQPYHHTKFLVDALNLRKWGTFVVMIDNVCYVEHS
jgi:hypothetical protein